MKAMKRRREAAVHACSRDVTRGTEVISAEPWEQAALKKTTVELTGAERSTLELHHCSRREQGAHTPHTSSVAQCE